MLLAFHDPKITKSREGKCLTGLLPRSATATHEQPPTRFTRDSPKRVERISVSVIRHDKRQHRQRLRYRTYHANYRRAFVPGGCWFFTVNLLERRQTLLVDHIDDLRDAVGRTRQGRTFTIDAFVVLPDHLHTVWTLPPADADFSTRWRLI